MSAVPYLDADALEVGLFTCDCQDMQNLQQRRSNELQQFLRRSMPRVRRRFLSADEFVFEFLPIRHAGRDTNRLQRAHVLLVHHGLLALHGRLTRYVAGARLAAFRWLQRRGWVRRAAVTEPRPSDTTDRPIQDHRGPGQPS